MASLVPPLPLARFSVEQYHRMIETGVFTEDDGLELIDGWLVRRTANGPAHEYTAGSLDDFLRQHVPAGWHVRNQAPVTLMGSEPEPDLTVVRGGRDAYRSRHPGPGDIGLVVEVSDASLDTDRIKGRVYGAAAVPTYWLVNLPGRCVEVYTDPRGSGDDPYATCRVLRQGESLPLSIDRHDCGRLAVDALLP